MASKDFSSEATATPGADLDHDQRNKQLQLQTLIVGLDPSQYDSALHALNLLQTNNINANKEVVEYDPEDYWQLREFWSTSSPQRTAKFKQIVLAKHIELHDFDAIFENSWGGKESRSSQFFDEEIVQTFSQVNLSLHLTLDTNARHEMPTPDWDAHRPCLTIQFQQCPAGGLRFESALAVACPGLDLWFRQGDDGAKLSSRKFDRLRQLFFDHDVPADQPEDWCRKPVEPLFAQKAKYSNILHEINAENIDTYDLSKVNIYHLVPKDKQMNYFWNRLKDFTIFPHDTSLEQLFALLAHGDGWLHPMWNGYDTEVSFDFDAFKIVDGEDSSEDA